VRDLTELDGRPHHLDRELALSFAMRAAQRSAWTLLVLLVASAARADGVMVYRGRELFREGPADRGYCDDAGSGSSSECDRVLSKVLSGYSYGRGHVSGGLAIDPGSSLASAQGVGALHVSVIAAPMPGGDIELASLDAVVGNAQTRRVRATLMDAEALFFCRDAQNGALVAPMIGMFTRACRTNAWLAVDLGLVAMQWDLATHRMLGEWARLGPVVELLGNGFGYAHTLRSIQLGVPFDVQSAHDSDQRTETVTTLGVGLRVSALYRSPQWEARLSARHRMVLAGEVDPAQDHGVDGELLLLHNFFLTDAVVVQAGLSLRASWSDEPQRAFAVWAHADRHTNMFAGIHLGWIHEPPGI
jgi:hypothetical protein